VGRDLLLCIIRVMECGWGWEAVIKLSKLIDYTFVLLSSYYWYILTALLLCVVVAAGADDCDDDVLHVDEDSSVVEGSSARA